MKREDISIILDFAHSAVTKGKCSPDGSFKEWIYSRMIGKMLGDKLKKEGFNVFYDVTEDAVEISLKERCRRVNQFCSLKGVKNCFGISLHTNAASSDGKWHSPSGFCVMVSPNASAKSKRLAQCIYDEVIDYKLQGNRAVPKEHYWVQNLAMCRDTNCPFVLGEALFQDNKQEVEWMLTKEGQETIVDVYYKGILKYVKETYGI